MPYHVIDDGWSGDHHPLDVDGNTSASVSFAAYKNAIGNGHYVTGQQIEPPRLKSYETTEVLAARRRVTEALHAMHANQHIRIDISLAQQLDDAWDAYDAALLATPQSGR